MLTRSERDYDILANLCIVQIGHRAPLNEAVRQVIGNIAQPCQTKLLQRAHEFGPDAVQRIGFSEQGIEPLGTHGFFLDKPAANFPPI